MGDERRAGRRGSWQERRGGALDTKAGRRWGWQGEATLRLALALQHKRRHKTYATGSH